MSFFTKSFCITLSLILFTGCSTTRQVKKPKQVANPTTHFIPASFKGFEGWDQDHHEKSFTAFATSCKKILKQKSLSDKKVGSDLNEWKKVCKAASNLSESLGDTTKLRSNELRKARSIFRNFFEKNFTPYKVGMSNHGHNLTFKARITGYYEIELHGAKKRTGAFVHPIHSPPNNLKKIKGSSSLRRAAINNGSLKDHGLEIAWIDDMSKLYFMQIQGSGVVRLKEGGEIPLKWGENGFSFKALPSEYLGSSTSVMKQLKANGHKGFQDMNRNESYVFFKPRRERHPVGAQNVMLTPERSAAIDSRIYPYGAPIWIETRLPHVKGYTQGESYRQMLIAQDRGGAIKGGGRLDLFLGRGKRAENIASSLSTLGNMYVLFPKGVFMPSIFNVK